MSTAIRDRAPAVPAAPERTERRPVMLVSFDVSFDEELTRSAIEAALEAGSELLICLAVTLPTANANAAARRTLGNPVVREEMQGIRDDARAAGAKAKIVLYSSPRPVQALFGVTESHGIGLLVFGPDRRRYGRLRFRWHLRRIKRNTSCLVLPLE